MNQATIPRTSLPLTAILNNGLHYKLFASQMAKWWCRTTTCVYILIEMDLLVENGKWERGRERERYRKRKEVNETWKGQQNERRKEWDWERGVIKWNREIHVNSSVKHFYMFIMALLWHLICTKHWKAAQNKFDKCFRSTTTMQFACLRFKFDKLQAIRQTHILRADTQTHIQL